VCEREKEPVSLGDTGFESLFSQDTKETGPLFSFFLKSPSPLKFIIFYWCDERGLLGSKRGTLSSNRPPRRETECTAVLWNSIGTHIYTHWLSLFSMDTHTHTHTHTLAKSFLFTA